ncbi:MAG TPA: flagellar protein [Clostridiaceae bacterium]|nr:flagellar protein [Clostridiaceae bacterium]
MAKLEVCARCGRFSEVTGIRKLCPECYIRDDKDFEKIREYLYIHPGAQVFEVSEKLHIPIPQIKRYLREERLEIIEDDNLFLSCESCGKPIRSGILCDNCKKSNPHDFQTFYVNNTPRKLLKKVNYIPTK